MLHLSRYLHLASGLLFCLLSSRSMTSKLDLEILERGKRVWSGKKKKKEELGKIGQGGNELKCQFQKHPVCMSISFQLREHGECGHLAEDSTQSCCVNDGVLPWKSRHVQDLVFPLMGNAIFLRMKFSSAEVNNSLLLLNLVYQNYILLLNLMLCCTGKCVFPLL